MLEQFQPTPAMHTASATVPTPSLGSWLSYGLGTFNQNLRPYLVLAEHMPYAGAQVWDSNFLPPYHQGVRLLPGNEPIADLRSAAPSITLAELEERMLQDVNDLHARERPEDLNLRARSQSFETARGMIRGAPRPTTRAAITTPEHSPACWPAQASRAACRTARPTSTASTSSQGRVTYTTTTPPSCTSWASTTRG